MLEQIILVSLSLAGVLFLLYKWEAIRPSWRWWCDFCFIFWIALIVNALYSIFIQEVSFRVVFALTFSETVAAYYIFLRIYYGTTTKR